MSVAEFPRITCGIGVRGGPCQRGGDEISEVYIQRVVGTPGVVVDQ